MTMGRGFDWDVCILLAVVCRCPEGREASISTRDKMNRGGGGLEGSLIALDGTARFGGSCGNQAARGVEDKDEGYRPVGREEQGRL